jgi:hypothetical protein
LASKKNTVVPVYIEPDDLLRRTFSKARYMHVSNSQRDKMLRSGEIELLDLAAKVYRLTERPGQPFFIASSANGSGAVSKLVPNSLQRLLASEITRMPYRDAAYV